MKRIGFVLGLSLLVFSCKGNLEGQTTKVEETVEEIVEVVDMHNSQNSLDWAGTYSGVVPCADCPGIEMELSLEYDNTYTLHTAYMERDTEFDYKGSFEWDDSGSTIYFVTEDDSKYIFKVQEASVRILDQEGNIITGELEDAYVLKQK